MNTTHDGRPVTVEELLNKSSNQSANNRSARKTGNFSYSMAQDIKNNTQVVSGVSAL